MDQITIHNLKFKPFVSREKIAKTNEFEFTLDKEEIEFADWYEMDDCLHRIRTGSIAYNLVKEFISTRKV